MDARTRVPTRLEKKPRCPDVSRNSHSVACNVRHISPTRISHDQPQNLSRIFYPYDGDMDIFSPSKTVLEPLRFLGSWRSERSDGL